MEKQAIEFIEKDLNKYIETKNLVDATLALSTAKQLGDQKKIQEIMDIALKNGHSAILEKLVGNSSKKLNSENPNM